MEMIASGAETIPNHWTPSLSELDLRMVRAVPPGGNWKNIPESIPSQRLKQIREGFAAGTGSRSTYYGRLGPDLPSYTISTYIGRPGNGCYAHYDHAGGQNRLISQREAARLQSFPDDFRFHGSKTAVNVQIGNAVPPLLAFQIAKVLASRDGAGSFLDLFSGAGGLSLGFRWAGWVPLVANDLNKSALETYRANVHSRTVLGDIREARVFDEVVSAGLDRTGFKDRPFYVLGGPPCQGFSTAGNRRSMDDARNLLFERYRAILIALRPDGFLFENVPGIKSIEKGAVFKRIIEALSIDDYVVTSTTLRAEEYGIPQRRTRVFIVGTRAGISHWPPAPITTLSPVWSPGYARAISVCEALGDLPPLVPGQNGSCLGYARPPENVYQAFCRRIVGAQELVTALETGDPDDRCFRSGAISKGAA